jgi:hypothetical protein
MILTKQQRAILVGRVCQMYDVRYRICRTIKSAEAHAYPHKNLLYVSRELFDRDAIVSAVMHEIGHIMAVRKGKWADYHREYAVTSPTLKQAISFKRTALPCERYVDDWAATQISRLFPSIEYSWSYHPLQKNEQFRQYVYRWADWWIDHHRACKKTRR